jgi:hypothetical protein
MNLGEGEEIDQAKLTLLADYIDVYRQAIEGL